VINFSEIVGGAPSTAGAITTHLLTKTLAPDQKLARYYGHDGGIHDPEMEALAQQVASGNILLSEATDQLMAQYVHQDGSSLEPEALDAAQAAIEKRLGDRVFRIQEGQADDPVAVLRPDMHPLVAQGLGIDPQGILSVEEIQNLLSGHRADTGQDIEGKVYAVERKLPANPKDGVEKVSQPIGS
jgi:hypothetical protein